VSGAQFFRCLNCQRLAKPDRCTQHNVILLEAAESVCRDFQNEAAPPVPQLDLDPNSLYLWIENPVTQQLELAALASFDFVRSWSSDEQRSMRAKRTQLRQFFRRAQL
jgi:hypothetical protein